MNEIDAELFVDGWLLLVDAGEGAPLLTTNHQPTTTNSYAHP
jgi:hypothetical protein